jgi:hypothetical protein
MFFVIFIKYKKFIESQYARKQNKGQHNSKR